MIGVFLWINNSFLLYILKFFNKEKQGAYFIELKGSDLIKAIEQIESTIPQIKGDIAEYKINARIVLTKQRTPDLIDSKMRNFEGKIKKMGGTFKKANIKMEEQI